jgi:hypothetical protein
MPDPAAVAGAFPLEASWIPTLGAGEFPPRLLPTTRLVRSPWEASPELETSPKSRESAAALAHASATGTTACAFGAGLGSGEVRAASPGDSSDPARTGVFSVASAVTSRVPSWLGKSEDTWAAASSPTTTPLAADERGAVAPAGVVSLASVESASGAAAGLGTAPAGASGRAGSSALALIATGSDHGESRSSSI